MQIPTYYINIPAYIHVVYIIQPTNKNMSSVIILALILVSYQLLKIPITKYMITLILIEKQPFLIER